MSKASETFRMLLLLKGPHQTFFCVLLLHVCLKGSPSMTSGILTVALSSKEKPQNCADINCGKLLLKNLLCIKNIDRNCSLAHDAIQITFLSLCGMNEREEL